MHFHYGQRVRCVKPVDGNDWIVGKIGTVIDTTVREKPGVLFDKPYSGNIRSMHGLFDDRKGFLDTDMGWNCYENNLVSLESLIGVDDLI